jgi:hypothetical protein
MATPVYPPTITTNVLVNTRLQPKIVYLPAASTIGPGRMMYIKDICGNAGASSIYISTTGLDSLEYKFRPSTLCAIMSTNFQSVLLASDGLLNWMILQNYNANAITRYNAYGPPTTNMILWLDSTDLTTLYQDSSLATPVTTVGQSVGGWKDKSGNNRSYLQPTSGSRGVYAAGPCVTFNSASLYLYSTNMPASNNNNDIFIVTKPLTLAQNSTWRTLFRGQNADHQVIIESGSTRLGTYHNNTGGFKQFGSLTLDGSTRVILEVQISSTNTYTASLNGGSFTAATSAGTADNLYALGNYQGGSQQWGEINELLIYNGAVNTATRETILSYLRQKWGVA